jgi:cold shock protein
MDNVRERGTVKLWHERRGFGFIAPDGWSNDVFVHISDCIIEGDILPKGSRVEFTTGTGRNGKPAAKDVVLLES